MTGRHGEHVLACWCVPADAAFYIDAAGRVAWKTPEAEASADAIDRMIAESYAWPESDACFFCGFELEPCAADGCTNFDCPNSSRARAGEDVVGFTLSGAPVSRLRRLPST